MALDPSQDPTSIYYKPGTTPSTAASTQVSTTPAPSTNGMQTLQATGANLAAQGKGYNALYKEATINQGLSPTAAGQLAASTYTSNSQNTNGVSPVTPTVQNSQNGVSTGVGMKPQVTNGGIIAGTPNTNTASSTGTLDQAKQGYVDALSGKASQEADINARQKDIGLQGEKVAGSNILDQQKYIQDQADITRKTNTINANAQIQGAQDAAKTMSQNFSYLAGAVGQPVSEVGKAGQVQQFQRATELVDRIRSLKELQDKGYDTQVAKQMADLQKDLDSNVSQSIQQQLNVIQKLNADGMLDTPQAIMKAKQDAYKNVIDTYNNSTIKNVELAKYYLDSVQKSVDESVKMGTFDKDFTTQVNDGYVYNANGQRMTDSTGQAIRGTQSKPIEQSIDNKDGTYSIMYKDGTFEKIKAGQDFSKAPDVNITKLLGPSTGFTYNSQGNIITDPTTGQPVPYKQTAEYQSVYIEDADGNKIPAAFNPATGAYTPLQQNPLGNTNRNHGTVSGNGSLGGRTYTPGSTDFRGLASKYPNVAAFKNNNPAGITWNVNFENNAGSAQAIANAGISFERGTDRPSAEGGNYVKFNSIEDGLAAQRIIMERTYGDSTVGKMLSSWVGTSEGPQYAASVAQAAGVDPNAEVSSLPPSALDALQVAKLKRESPGLSKELEAAGIVEGNTINFPQQKVFTPDQVESGQAGPTAQGFMNDLKNNQFTVSVPGTKSTDYTVTQSNLLDKILANKATESELKEYKKGVKNGIYSDDATRAYAANKPVSTELSDDQRAVYTSQLNNFRGNQIVKDYEQQIGNVSNTVASLNSNSGPGDIASVFSFMKALDPASTVREGEFALAAKSAGVVDSIGNSFSKLENGQSLSEGQKVAFAQLMKSYLDNKGKQYDRLYDDMARVTELSGIPKEYLPKRASEEANNIQASVHRIAPSGKKYNINDVMHALNQ